MDKPETFLKCRGLRYVSCPDQYGYGMAARAYIHGLMKIGIPLTWTPMFDAHPWTHPYFPTGVLSPEYAEIETVCNRSIHYDTVIIHAVPEYYPLWIKREKGKYLIGYTVWETDLLPSHWPPLLNQMDMIMVPTKWNRDVFKSCGVTVPIEVIPHIHVPLFSENPDPDWDIDKKERVFYIINDWTIRKAVWKTIECYLETFTADDPTLLIVKTSRHDFTQKNPWKRFSNTKYLVQKMCRRYRNPARILLLNSHLSSKQIAAIHTRGECYISLGHSEGWGLGAFDAAGAGNAVIITDYGGPREYLPRDLAFLVNCTEMPVSDHTGAGSYTSDQHWGQPDLDVAKNFIRLVFNQPLVARSMGEKLRAAIRSSFSEKVVIDKLKKVLEGV